MKVAVLGAGIIGVSTAYFLAKAGAQVTVVEREPEAAMGCSYANGAQLSYSHADPWASYRNVWKGIKWIGHANAPLLLRPQFDPDMYKWLLNFLLNCAPLRVMSNTKAILHLGFYSRKILHELMATENLSFDYSPSGILHIFKSKLELSLCSKMFENLQNLEPKLDFQILSKAGCVELDPAIGHLMSRRTGGILCKADEVGDTFKFTHSLEAIAKSLGVEFLYNTEVLGLHHGHKPSISEIILEERNLKVDAVVVCLGAYGGPFLRRYGVDLPIYPMKGYSISVPTDDGFICPKVSITDQHRKIVFSRIGNTLRIGGTAEFTGYNHEVLSERIAPILNTAKKYFPQGGDYSRKTSWACLRPQTPHSYPYISRALFKNLYINMGHGSLGWTQAFGSSKAVADLVMKKVPELDLRPYRI